MVQFRTAYRFENAALGDPIYRIADASAEPASETYFINEAVELLLRSKSPAVRHVPHIDGSLAPEVLAQVVDQFSAAIAPLRAAPSSTHAQIAALHAIDGVRMLSAHRRGPLGVSALNDAIVAALRTESDRGAWWVGRLILVTSNDHDLQLWNGDVGLVTQNESGWQVVFPTADGVRLVAVPALPEHETAFVMTIHKSQGSQFGHAVVVLPSEETMILSRELVYTGISRAKAQLTLCGDESVLRGALSRRVLRASGLRERIGAIPLPPSG
jgi:exodeoxyribonuclease V alpha subunit